MRDKTTSRHHRTRRWVHIWPTAGQDTDDAAPSASFDGWLRLASSGRAVQAIDARDDPLVTLLVTEDACWLFAVEDWRRRRPGWWRCAARRVWLSEAALLVAKRDRLLDLTEDVPTRRLQEKPSIRTPQLPS